MTKLRFVVLLLVLGAAALQAQLPFAVRREAMEWRDSAATRAIMWSPMGKQGELPTLLFSPGFGQAPQDYSKLISTWVSRGFVVIGVPHPPFADADTTKPHDVSQALAWQLSRALEHIVHEKTKLNPMFARVDPTRIGAIGHAIGGSAAAQACAMEQRLRACMNLDGKIFGSVVHLGMTQPFFLLRKRGAPGEDSVFANSRTMYWLTVDNLDHMSFIDAKLDATHAEEVKSVIGFRLPAAKAQEMATRYAVDFFAAYLRGDPRPFTLDRTPFKGTELRIKR